MLLATSTIWQTQEDPLHAQYGLAVGKVLPTPDIHIAARNTAAISGANCYIVVLIPLERQVFLLAILQTARAESEGAPSKDFVVVRIGLYRCDLGRMYWRYSVCMSSWLV